MCVCFYSSSFLRFVQDDEMVSFYSAVYPRSLDATALPGPTLSGDDHRGRTARSNFTCINACIIFLEIAKFPTGVVTFSIPVCDSPRAFPTRQMFLQSIAKKKKMAYREGLENFLPNKACFVLVRAIFICFM